MSKTILVTGGAGFIGSCFIRRLAERPDIHTLNLDKLTYAGNLDSIAMVPADRTTFVHGDICNGELVAELLARYRPQAIVHFAAESHVDRSIDGPLTFVQTNVMGTAVLLDTAKEYWRKLHAKPRRTFAFCISLPMRSSVRFRWVTLLKTRRINLAHHTRLAKLALITCSCLS